MVIQKGAYSVKGCFEIKEAMIQILLMLEVRFSHDSKTEELFLVRLPALNPARPSAMISSAWG